MRRRTTVPKKLSFDSIFVATSNAVWDHKCQMTKVLTNQFWYRQGGRRHSVSAKLEHPKRNSYFTYVSNKESRDLTDVFSKLSDRGFQRVCHQNIWRRTSCVLRHKLLLSRLLKSSHMTVLLYISELYLPSFEILRYKDEHVSLVSSYLTRWWWQILLWMYLHRILL